MKRDIWMIVGTDDVITMGPLAFEKCIPINDAVLLIHYRTTHVAPGDLTTGYNTNRAVPTTSPAQYN